MAHGFVLRIPVVTFHTWSGSALEGKGVEPDCAVELSRNALKQSRDIQLTKAAEVASSLSESDVLGQVVGNVCVNSSSTVQSAGHGRAQLSEHGRSATAVVTDQLKASSTDAEGSPTLFPRLALMMALPRLRALFFMSRP